MANHCHLAKNSACCPFHTLRGSHGERRPPSTIPPPTAAALTSAIEHVWKLKMRRGCVITGSDAALRNNYRGPGAVVVVAVSGGISRYTNKMGGGGSGRLPTPPPLHIWATWMFHTSGRGCLPVCVTDSPFHLSELRRNTYFGGIVAASNFENFMSNQERQHDTSAVHHPKILKCHGEPAKPTNQTPGSKE